MVKRYGVILFVKRTNPDTKELFKKGDSRASSDKQDGKLFEKYSASRMKKDGYCNFFVHLYISYILQ